MVAKRVELKDAWEYVLERITKIFTRLAFNQLHGETVRSRLLSGTCTDFQQLKWTLKSKKIVAAWRRLTKIDREIMPKLVSIHEQNLIRTFFNHMKCQALEDEGSHRRMLARLSNKIRIIQLRNLFANMLDWTKISKQMKNGKSRACLSLATKLSTKSALKLRNVIKQLRLSTFGESKFVNISRIMENRLCSTSISKLKLLNTQLKQKEVRATRFCSNQSLKLRRACYAEMKKLATRTSNLMQLSGVFSKMHLQFYCKGILTSWAKYTLLTGSSGFQKSIRAGEHMRHTLKQRVLQAMRILATEKHELLTAKARARLEDFKVRRVWVALRAGVGDARRQRNREVLRDVWEQWRGLVLLAKEQLAVDNAMREQEEDGRSREGASGFFAGGAGDFKERKRNERFLMLIDVGHRAGAGGDGQLGGRDGRAGGVREIGGWRDRRDIGEGTVFTSEAGTDDLNEEMAIKSAF
jgi:hypothetical protein